MSSGTAGQGTELAAPLTPCRLLATAPAPRLIHSFWVLLNFHAAGSLQLPGRHRLQAGFPQPCSPMPALPAGQSCTPSPPVSCCYIQDTDTLLVLLLLVPGLNLPGCLLLRNSQHPQPGLHSSAPDPPVLLQLLQRVPSCYRAMFSPQGEQPAACHPPSCSCPDAAGDLSQVPPLGWKNPRPGSCKASSRPHTADQVGTSFPWLQQERGARGFAAKPEPSAPTGVKGGGWPHTASRCSL